MKISELIKKIHLIIDFVSKMNTEAVPLGIQKIFIKLYASNLNFNLTDKMVENILQKDNIVT
jgi:hypothetical protein